MKYEEARKLAKCAEKRGDRIIIRGAVAYHESEHFPKLLEKVKMVLRGVAEISELHAIVAECEEVEEL